MDKNTMIKVANRNGNRVGYTIPEMGIRRQFTARQTKEVSFEELQNLAYLPGGMKLLKDYLVIKDMDALKALEIDVEPEYFYTEDDVKKLLTTGTLDEFLDCLDFAPDGVLDTIKDLAVKLPLNDVAKRNAIQKKLGFNVTKAIEIQNTKLDGGDEEKNAETPVRRVATPVPENERRAAAPKYKVTSIQE